MRVVVQQRRGDQPGDRRNRHAGLYRERQDGEAAQQHDYEQGEAQIEPGEVEQPGPHRVDHRPAARRIEPAVHEELRHGAEEIRRITDLDQAQMRKPRGQVERIDQPEPQNAEQE